MAWNWELENWPAFFYDSEQIIQMERQFLLGSGGIIAILKTIEKNDYHQFLVEILSTEGIESSKIEGELLEREGLQSSIKKCFGLKTNRHKESKKEFGMAELFHDVYTTFQQPLSHEMLYRWHALLFKDQTRFETGKYRTHEEPMQIISNRYGSQKVFFEAPPSNNVFHEMDKYLKWFNSTETSETTLGRAAIAHLYFESIYPFEDGNGRIGRVLVEKILSQRLRNPALIAVSKILEDHKKDYYTALEKCNRTLDANQWVIFFAQAILQAEKESSALLAFLVEKSKLLTRISNSINPRQKKVILKMFENGPNGLKGGLSAENYIAITKTSRATATRDLTDLVNIGALRKTGEVRHTRYWLNVTAPN